MSSFIIPALITIVIFIGLLLLIYRTGGDQKSNVRERLERMEPGSFSRGDDHNPETSFLDEEGGKTGLAVFGETLLKMMGQDVRELEKKLQLQLVQAGIYSPNAVAYYYLFRIIGVPLAIVLAFILYASHAEGMERMGQMLAIVIVLLLSWYGPNILLSNSKQKRQHLLQRSFPDTLDLILVCVESGLALDAALARVCRELGRAHPEITKELNRTRMELTLLSDRSQALQNLAERTDMIAFRSLVAALMQTEKFGTSLTETLRVLSDDYRHTRLMAAETKAGRLPAMMTVPMILLMMPSLMLIIMGPAIISLMEALGN